MKNLTANQHLQWSLDGEPFAERLHTQQKFNFTLGKMDRPLMPWWSELQSAMRQLVSEHGSNLALFYSGGSDSEVILRALLHIGIKPSIYTIKFSKGENEHETKFASELCASLGLKQTVFTHDVDHFINGRMWELGSRYQCSQMAYLTVLEYVMKVDEPAIMGGEVYLQKHQKHSDTLVSPEEWYYIYREDEDGMTYRYSKATGHVLINEVLTYTPGLLLSYLQHPTIKKVASNQVPGKITLLSVKKDVYEAEMGHELFAKTKFHGYEALSWTNRSMAQELKALFPKQQVARLEYNQLVKDLSC